MMDPAKIEELAIRAATGANGGEWTIHYNDDQKEFWRQFVRDIGAAMVPEGYVIVPRGPTSEMVKAAMAMVDPLGRENYISREDTVDVYHAMINARPR